MMPSLLSSHRQILSCLKDLKVQYQELHGQIKGLSDNAATKDDLVALQGLYATKDDLIAREKEIREEIGKKNALLQV